FQLFSSFADLRHGIYCRKSLYPTMLVSVRGRGVRPLPSTEQPIASWRFLYVSKVSASTAKTSRRYTEAGGYGPSGFHGPPQMLLWTHGREAHMSLDHGSGNRLLSGGPEPLSKACVPCGKQNQPDD